MERLSADDYFTHALVVLGQHGPEGLTIAALCERLQVTKGSFYHHFGALPGFVDALLLFWESEHSARLIETSTAQPDPALRILTLTDMAIGLPHAPEAAIRAWARSNDLAAQAVGRVDRRRDRAVMDALVVIGIDRVRARMWSRLALSLLIGVQSRERIVDLRRLRQMFEEVLQVVFTEADPRLAERLIAASG